MVLRFCHIKILTFTTLGRDGAAGSEWDLPAMVTGGGGGTGGTGGAPKLKPAPAGKGGGCGTGGIGGVPKLNPPPATAGRPGCDAPKMNPPPATGGGGGGGGTPPLTGGGGEEPLKPAGDIGDARSISSCG